MQPTGMTTTNCLPPAGSSASRRGRGLLQMAAEAWQQGEVEACMSEKGKGQEHPLQYLGLYPPSTPAQLPASAATQDLETCPSTPARQHMQTEGSPPGTPVYPPGPHIREPHSMPLPCSTAALPTELASPPMPAYKPGTQTQQLVTVHLVGPTITHHVQVAVSPPVTVASIPAGTQAQPLKPEAMTVHKQPVCSILLPPDAPPTIQVLLPPYSPYAPSTMAVQQRCHVQQAAPAHAGGHSPQIQQSCTRGTPQSSQKQEKRQSEQQQQLQQHDRAQQATSPPTAAAAEWQQGIDSALLAAAQVADLLLMRVLAVTRQWRELDAREQALQADTALWLERMELIADQGQQRQSSGEQQQQQQQQQQQNTDGYRQLQPLQVMEQQHRSSHGAPSPPAHPLQQGQGQGAQQLGASLMQASAQPQAAEQRQRQEADSQGMTSLQAASTQQRQLLPQPAIASQPAQLTNGERLAPVKSIDWPLRAWQHGSTGAAPGVDSTPKYKRVWPVMTTPDTPRYPPVHAAGMSPVDDAQCSGAMSDRIKAIHHSEEDWPGIVLRLDTKLGVQYDDWTASAKQKQRGKSTASQTSLAGRLAAAKRRQLRVAPCATIATQPDAVTGHRPWRQKIHAAHRQTFRKWLQEQHEQGAA